MEYIVAMKNRPIFTIAAVHYFQGDGKGNQYVSIYRFVGRVGDMRGARNQLKKQFKEDGIIIAAVGEVRLDDEIPDEWYESWKKMESPITMLRDFPGYYEAEVDPDRGL